MNKKRALVVTEAVNRKNGGNGSILDLIHSLGRTLIDLKIVLYKRYRIAGLIEAFLNNELPTRLLIGIESLGRFITRKLSAYERYDFVFVSSSISYNDLERLRLKVEAKYFTFQTSDIPLESQSMMELYCKRLKLFDVILFESPEQYLLYGMHVCREGMPKPILTYATVNESCLHKINKGKKIHKNGAFKFICVGSLQPRKNQKYLLEAFKYLVEIYSAYDCELIIVGPKIKGFYKYYEELVDFCKLNKHLRITITGHRSDYQHLIRLSDVMVVASHEEGLATVIREAAYFSIPIIASDIPGNRGSLISYTNSILYDNNKPFSHLAEIMYMIRNNPQLLESLAVQVNRLYESKLSNIVYDENIRTAIAD